jgi:hypothetical protein
MTLVVLLAIPTLNSLPRLARNPDDVITLPANRIA